MKNKIVKLGVTFLLSFSLITPFYFNEVKAANNISLPYTQPSTSDNQGYVNVLFQDKNDSSLFVMTFVWNITNETNDGNSGMQLSFTDSKVTFTSQLTNGSSGYSLIYNYSSAGSSIGVKQYQYFTGSCTSYSYSTSHKIVGFQAYGNVKKITDELTTHKAFAISYGNDSYYKDLMDNISGNVSNIYSQLKTANTWLSTLEDSITVNNQHTVTIKNTLDDIKTILDTKLTDIKTILSDKLDYVADRIKITNTNLVNIYNKITELLTTDKDLSSDIDNGNNINSDLNENINNYNDLESNFHDSMNDSLNNIDTDLDLFGNNDFIKTATFISTNINRIVTSNAYYNAFVITGLVLGIALVMIGKKVI